MNSRRAFLGFIGKAAAAAPALPHVVSQAVADEVAGASRYTYTTLGVQGYTDLAPRTHELSRSAFNALLRKRERTSEVLRLEALHRVDGCDPEVHCLRSLSAASRRRMQLRRDLANRDKLTAMGRKLWPEVV